MRGAFHLGKTTGNFGWNKSGISDWLKVAPFGRKARHVAVSDRGPGTGTNYKKSKWNTTFRSEIPTGKTGPPFWIFHCFWEYSPGGGGHLDNFWVGMCRPGL